MANYREIVRRFPAARHYVRQRRWVERGDVTAYEPNVEAGAFSTDAYGFRHTELNGIRYDLSAAFGREPYGLVLGSSHVFGFGLESNAQTIPSRLSARLDLPCLNVSFPEADLRTMHAVAARITSQAARPPMFICCFVGGTLTRYCYRRRCDPLFGAPDFRKPSGGEAGPGSAPEAAAFSNLLTYSRFWLDQLHAAAEAGNLPLLVHTESTAFEKTGLSDGEQACGLTVPNGPAEQNRFDTHRLRYAEFKQQLSAWMDGRVLLARTEADALSFIDEFHYAAEGIEVIAASLAARLQAKTPDRSASELPSAGRHALG